MLTRLTACPIVYFQSVKTLINFNWTYKAFMPDIALTMASAKLWWFLSYINFAISWSWLSEVNHTIRIRMWPSTTGAVWLIVQLYVRKSWCRPSRHVSHPHVTGTSILQLHWPWAFTTGMLTMLQFSNSILGLIYSAFHVKLLPGICYRISLMITQHWFR